jgi:hypothetical protein
VCLAFTGHASLLGPHCIDRRKLCRTEKPADKRRPSRELFRVACSCNENALRNIFGALPVASVAERDTVNKSNSTVNELGEGRFGAFEGVAAEKFWPSLRVIEISPHAPEIAQIRGTQRGFFLASPVAIASRESPCTAFQGSLGNARRYL